MRKLINSLKSRKGQGAVEYALVVAAIVAIIGVVLALNNNNLQTAIQNAFQNAVNAVGGGGATPPAP